MEHFLGQSVKRWCDRGRPGCGDDSEFGARRYHGSSGNVGKDDGDSLDDDGRHINHVRWLVPVSLRGGGEESASPRRKGKARREVGGEECDNAHGEDDKVGKAKHLDERGD